MERIHNVSHFLKICFIAVLVFILIYPFAIWGFYQYGSAESSNFGFWMSCFSSPIVTPNKTYILGSVPLSHLSRFIGFMADMISNGITAVAIWALINVFRHYETGKIFSLNVVRYYRQIGIVLFAQALFSEPLNGALKVLAVTLSNPPGQRMISVSFGSPQVGELLIGFVIIVISWIMEEGRRLQDEQALTI